MTSRVPDSIPLQARPGRFMIPKYEAPQPIVGRGAAGLAELDAPEKQAVDAATGGLAIYAHSHSQNQPRVVLSGSRFLRTFPRLGGFGSVSSL
jgi:hypothetical protein